MLDGVRMKRRKITINLHKIEHQEMTTVKCSPKNEFTIIEMKKFQNL